MPPFLVPRPVLARLAAATLVGTPSDAAATDAVIAATGPALRRLADAYRLDTLAGLRAARHGWLGASFSCLDLLTTLYHRAIGDPRRPLTERDSLVLSKGHAAMGHYAVLAGMGAFPAERLLTYKAREGLPAHSDRETPGVDADSGSLGMGLSKAIGIAAAHRHAGRPHRCFCLLGDGELQEGQVFESLLTLRRLDLRTCVAIVDRNRLQSDSCTEQIKDADDWAMVGRGIGLEVATIDGHDPTAVLGLLLSLPARQRPLLVLADTVKGGPLGPTAMPAATTPRRGGVWHGRIPDDREALAIERSLVDRIGDPELSDLWRAARVTYLSSAVTRSALVEGTSGTVPRPAGAPVGAPNLPSASVVACRQPTATMSTGAAFGAAVARAMDARHDLFCLDADLEKACHLTAAATAHPDRFIEAGISEQDMVSLAAGLALAGQTAVVNTYAAFFRRALDQVQAVAAEGLPVVFAAHYAGLDYFTDGKSHQSLNDLAIARAIPNLEVHEPLADDEVVPLLAAILDRFAADRRDGRRSTPAWVRLHRTAADHPLPAPPVTPAAPFVIGRPRPLWPVPTTTTAPDGGSAAHPDPAPARLFVASPQLALIAVAAARELATPSHGTDREDPDGGRNDRGRGRHRLPPSSCTAADDIGIEVYGISTYSDPTGDLKRLLTGTRRCFSLESHLRQGGLADFLAAVAQVGIVRIGARAPTGSTRTLAEMLAWHDLTPATVVKVIRKALACTDTWRPGPTTARPGGGGSRP